MKWYLWHVEKMADFCKKFKQYVIDEDFTDKKTKTISSKPDMDTYCWCPRYEELWKNIYDIISICDMFGIEELAANQPMLNDRVVCLHDPMSIQIRNAFEAYIDFIINSFTKFEKEIKNKLQLLSEEEKNRLNEALNCYIMGCNYSAIAMSVSAVESRLFSLMMSKCPSLELEELTLGQLINEYLNNKQKYGNVIPKKHLSLLEYCNTYRVFSVHPKKEKITRAIATSIINMTFSFLLDEELKHKVEEIRK
jgi:hypothetical protein